jgi:hypothetical protein
MGTLGVGMAKTSLKYEQPSWASQLLVLGFSVAVAFMAGWLVLTIMLGNSGTNMVATADDEVPAMATKQPPRVESPRIAASPPIVAPRQLLSPQADPGSAPGAAPAASPGPAAAAKVAPPAAAAAPPAPMGTALASLPPVVTAPATAPAAPSPMAAGSINDRTAVADIYGQVTNKIGDEPTDAPEIVPLPPPRPRVASVPFPRPRPQMEAQVQAQPEPRSWFDIITGGR